MKRASHQFLAGPCFTSYQHRRVGWRNAGNLLTKPANRGLRPVISEEPSSRNTASRSLPFSRKSRVCSTARPADASRTSGTNGLVMKSKEPRRMLSTASSMVANAVRKTTDKAESVSCAALEHPVLRHRPFFGPLSTASKRHSESARRASLDAGRLDYLVALMPQIRGQDLPHVRLVIYDQYLPHRVFPSCDSTGEMRWNLNRETYQSGSLTSQHDDHRHAPERCCAQSRGRARFLPAW